MMKNFLFLLMMLITVSACKDDKKQIGDYKAIEVKEDVVNALPDAPSSRQFQEEDYQGRLEFSLEKVQHEFHLSKGKVNNQGDVTLYVDQNFNLMLRHKFKGDTYDTKVNLADLSVENGTIKLIIDQKAGDNPGITFYTEKGDKKVVKTKNGELVEETDHISFILAGRPNVENMLPGMVAAIRVAKEKFGK